MLDDNTYYWLKPARLPVLESVGLILMMIWIAIAFKYGSLALIFEYEDHSQIKMHPLAFPIQQPESSKPFYP